MTHTNTWRGFTLMEVLVVVIIIAVLAAIAVPQYQKAVLKSRFSTLMPVAKSIASAEEIYFLNQGNYANSIAQLDVASLESDSNAQVSVSQAGDRADGFDYVFANRSDTPGVAYIIYQDRSGQFPGAVMCEANDELNSNATWLCQKSLNGQDMGGSLQGEGWNAYLLSGSNVGRFGSAADEIRKTCNQTEGCSATVNKETGEVTTTQCDTANKQNIVITYADDGTQTGYRREQCKLPAPYYTDGIFSNCTCNPRNQNEWYMATYDENDNVLTRHYCETMSGGVCTGGFIQRDSPYYSSLYGEPFEEKFSTYCVEGTGPMGNCTIMSITSAHFREGYTSGAVGVINIWCSGTAQADGTCAGGTWMWSRGSNYHACTSYETINWEDLTCS